MRVKLLAAVALLATWLEVAGDEFDFDELRRQLNLPTPTPIVLDPNALGALPVTRLERVDVAGLSDKDLEQGFHRAALFAIRNALRRFAAEIVGRDSLSGQVLQQEAYEWLARTARDFSKALECIEKGRQAGKGSGKSCASWDLLEMSFRIGLHDGEGVMRLVQHIDKQHKREPEAIEACVHMLVEAGLLRPDGTPAKAAGEESPPLRSKAPPPSRADFGLPTATGPPRREKSGRPIEGERINPFPMTPSRIWISGTCSGHCPGGFGARVRRAQPDGRLLHRPRRRNHRRRLASPLRRRSCRGRGPAAGRGPGRRGDALRDPRTVLPSGKTPPCTRAILAAGIRRVVAAMPDPFPQVAGGGTGGTPRGRRRSRRSGCWKTKPGG